MIVILYYSCASYYHWEKHKISLFYFLQLHMNLQLSQNKMFNIQNGHEIENIILKLVFTQNFP